MSRSLRRRNITPLDECPIADDVDDVVRVAENAKKVYDKMKATVDKRSEELVSRAEAYRIERDELETRSPKEAKTLVVVVRFQARRRPRQRSA
jgi:hypothetical protein